MRSIEQARGHLLDIYHSALAAVDGRQAVRRRMQAQPLSGEWALVAIGKAAQSMAMGAREVMGDALPAGLLIGKAGHLDPAWLAHTPYQGIEGGHPVPDGRSLEAGRVLLEFIAAQPADRPLLFLISGGASSLVEVLPEGVELADLQLLNRWMLANGLSIGRMNGLRRCLSLIKGGGLLDYLGGRHAEVWLISDVPGDDPAVIGSGLLLAQPPCPPRLDDLALPDALRELLERNPQSGADRARIGHSIVANLHMALEAAAERARELGYQVRLSRAHISGEALTVGQRMALEITDALPGVLHLWGGESSVMLPDEPGRGGRNQHLALAAATLLAGRDDLCFLAAGTDGTDGPGEDAGALVDGATLARGRREGLDADDCLFRADSGSFLAASGDLIHTGPTGTNVMDLMIGVRF